MRTFGTLPLLVLAWGALLAPTAGAQNYTASGFGLSSYNADGDCGDPTAPCFLRDALEDATDGGLSGSELLVRLPNVGGTTWEPHNSIAIDDSVTFDTYLDDGIPTAGVPGTFVLEGGLTVAPNVEVTLRPNLVFRLQGSTHGNTFLQMGLGSSFEDEGELVLVGPHRIVLGDPDGSPIFGITPLIHNLRIDGGEGAVAVFDERFDDLTARDLLVQSLRVEGGVFDLQDNVLVMTGTPQRIEVAAGAEIRGTGTMRLRLTQGVFPDTREGALRITGGGRIAIDFLKFYDGGLVYELPELGNGGTSRNFKGAMFFPRPVTIHGSFIHEPEDFSPARTEFDAPARITGDVVFPNPGGELPPGDGLCDTGDESVLVFHAPVDIGGDLVLHDTDWPATAPCVEGVIFSPDGLLGGNQARSTVAGSLNASGATQITLGADGIAHNLLVEGDVAFDDAPLFDLQDPSAGGERCEGNELVFGGPRNPQALGFRTDLAIPSLRLQKATAGGGVVVGPGSASLLVDTALTLARGIFQDNGSLDPASAQPAAGVACASCPAFPRDDCLESVEPGGSLLVLGADKGKLAFKWTRGEETKREQLGSPTSDTDYSFCLYDAIDGDLRLALAASLPGGTSWTETPTGAVYARAGGAPDGLRKAKLKTGPDGVAKVSVAGKGLPLPALPLSQSPRVIAQLVNTAGTCWSAEFRNSPRKNNRRKFKDRE